MKTKLLLISLVFTGYLARGETVFTVSKTMAADSLRKDTAMHTAGLFDSPIVMQQHPDTAAQNHLNWLLGLPPQLTVVSCELLYNSAGELFKTSWSVNEPGRWANMQALMGRAKPKDKLTFVNIYVLKGDKRMRLADKTIEIQ